MRAKFAFPFVTMILLVSVILLVETERGTSAPAPQKGGGGNKGGFKFDPAQIFEMTAKGKDFFLISEMMRGKEEMEFFAKDNGITDGKITKALYLKFWDQREAIREKYKNELPQGGPFGGKKGKKKDEKGEGGTKEDAKKKDVPDEKAIDEEAERMFGKFDSNSDGFLNPEEIGKTTSFKSEWEKWDANKDKLISLGEWKLYYQDMKKRKADERAARSESKNKKKIVEDDDEDDERIMVYRFNKLPANLPEWFKELDTDKDGQVSLYEWNQGRKDLEEFEKMDRNGDGFLTAEEYLFYQRVVLEAPVRNVEVASTIKGSNPNASQKYEEPKGGKGDYGRKKGERKKGGG